MLTASNRVNKVLDPIVTPPPLHELAYMYQPIVAPGGREPTWAEALVRWRLPDGTVRGPLDILPHWLAEPRQEAFTRFSIERAAATLSSHAGAVVSMNLSPNQVMHSQTPTSLDRLLPAVRRRLRVELTEQSFGDGKRLWSSLALLRERCGAVLLDDLTEADARERIPSADLVDGVKVDRSVTAGLADPRLRGRLERFVRGLADRFPIVVVEGVEDPAIADGLFELGATHLQGFGIGQPSPDLVAPLFEPRLPDFEDARARAVRLNTGSLMLGGSDTELHS